MAHVHKGLKNQVLGNIHTSGEFTVRMKHVMYLKSLGYPVTWYCDKHNRVRILRNRVWWVIDRLAEYEPLYDWEATH